MIAAAPRLAPGFRAALAREPALLVVLDADRAIAHLNPAWSASLADLDPATAAACHPDALGRAAVHEARRLLASTC